MAGRFFFGVGPRGEGANQGWAFERQLSSHHRRAAQANPWSANCICSVDFWAARMRELVEIRAPDATGLLAKLRHEAPDRNHLHLADASRLLEIPVAG